MLFGVLTVSDRCSRGEMQDTSGPAVVEILRKQFGSAEIDSALAPDDEEQVVARLDAWCERGAVLVLTVGGTGLGPRDRTPEATRRVIDREAPGLAEAIRAMGAARNQFAWLSRGVAGLKGATLIVNLPGSQRGATESLRAILAIVEHGIDVAAGGQQHPVR